MIKFISIFLIIMDCIIYRYSGFSGVIICTIGFFVAWLSIFVLAMCGGDSFNWYANINARR